MPICIECRYPVHQLYTTYSAADDLSLGKGVRLTQCPRCKRFADKYVEHDFVVLFIDLVLIKPQVYRHLLFNRLGREDDRFDVSNIVLSPKLYVGGGGEVYGENLYTYDDAKTKPSIIRLGTLLLLFDVYLTWARIEKQSPKASAASLSSSSSSPAHAFGHLAAQPIVLQYLFFLFLCLTESILFHVTIRLLTQVLLSYHRPNSVSTALLVSSCTKLFPILMVIWDYDVPAAARSVGWAVVVNNIEALRILLDCGYVMAALLAGTGAFVRFASGWCVLRAIGLEQAAGRWGGGGLADLGQWGRYIGGLLGVG
ncbi:MAG: sterol homeostasis protein [Sclerophora amabilis]|nr:MAG: sterol homeostasis protein [Sclerophora amabilis]